MGENFSRHAADLPQDHFLLKETAAEGWGKMAQIGGIENGRKGG